jgi:hypothetical protein
VYNHVQGIFLVVPFILLASRSAVVRVACNAAIQFTGEIAVFVITAATSTSASSSA